MVVPLQSNAWTQEDIRSLSSSPARGSLSRDADGVAKRNSRSPKALKESEHERVGNTY